MTTINWNEAPEGATHYNSVTEDIRDPWLRITPLSFWNGTEWRRYKNRSIGIGHISEATPRPGTASSSEVGSILEYLYSEGYWRKGEVIALAKGKIVIMDLEDEVVGIYAKEETRPLKEEAITAIRELITDALRSGEDPATAIYGAGYRL